MKDRELVSAPANRSARNGQNTKSFRGARLLTTARGWHGPFTPAHGISQNRPKQSGLTIDIWNTAAKRDKHAADVEAAGDEFVAPAFTPSGTPYPSAIKFLRRIAHSGDKLDRSAGRDAPRFHHECTASTFMTPTHVAFMVHMCAAATARASAKAARLYAHERATRHSLRENTLNRPAIIPAPF